MANDTPNNANNTNDNPTLMTLPQNVGSDVSIDVKNMDADTLAKMRVALDNLKDDGSGIDYKTRTQQMAKAMVGMKAILSTKLPKGVKVSEVFEKLAEKLIHSHGNIDEVRQSGDGWGEFWDALPSDMQDTTLKNLKMAKDAGTVLQGAGDLWSGFWAPSVAAFQAGGGLLAGVDAGRKMLSPAMTEQQALDIATLWNLADYQYRQIHPSAANGLDKLAATMQNTADKVVFQSDLWRSMPFWLGGFFVFLGKIGDMISGKKTIAQCWDEAMKQAKDYRDPTQYHPDNMTDEQRAKLSAAGRENDHARHTAADMLENAEHVDGYDTKKLAELMRHGGGLVTKADPNRGDDILGLDINNPDHPVVNAAPGPDGTPIKLIDKAAKDFGNAGLTLLPVDANGQFSGMKLTGEIIGGVATTAATFGVGKKFGPPIVNAGAGMVGVGWRVTTLHTPARLMETTAHIVGGRKWSDHQNALNKLDKRIAKADKKGWSKKYEAAKKILADIEAETVPTDRLDKMKYDARKLSAEASVEKWKAKIGIEDHRLFGLLGERDGLQTKADAKENALRIHREGRMIRAQGWLDRATDLQNKIAQAETDLSAAQSDPQKLDANKRLTTLNEELTKLKTTRIDDRTGLFGRTIKGAQTKLDEAVADLDPAANKKLLRQSARIVLRTNAADTIMNKTNDFRARGWSAFAPSSATTAAPAPSPAAAASSAPASGAAPAPQGGTATHPAPGPSAASAAPAPTAHTAAPATTTPTPTPDVAPVPAPVPGEAAAVAKPSKLLKMIRVGGGVGGAGAPLFGAAVGGLLSAANGGNVGDIAKASGAGALDGALPGVTSGFKNITENNAHQNWVDQMLNAASTATQGAATVTVVAAGAGAVAAPVTGGASLIETAGALAVAGVSEAAFVGVGFAHDFTKVAGVSKQGGIIYGGIDMVKAFADSKAGKSVQDWWDKTTHPGLAKAAVDTHQRTLAISTGSHVSPSHLGAFPSNGAQHGRPSPTVLNSKTAAVVHV